MLLLAVLVVGFGLVKCDNGENATEILTENVHVTETENGTLALKFYTPCTTPNGDDALCRDLHTCPLFSERITKNDENYRFLVQSSCGPANAKIKKVCCGKYSNFITEQALAEITPELTPQVSPQVQPPLPPNCGVQKINIINRIFGGNEAKLGQFPWLVKIVHRSKNGYKSFGCSAVLVHERFVVTAAHCVASRIISPLGEIVQVILGDHNLRTENDCEKTNPSLCAPAPVVVATGKIQVHTGYKNTSMNHNNDIAIIPLKNSVQFTDFIQPICLASEPMTEERLWLSGWGKTETDDSSDVKQVVDVPRVNTKVCIDKYKTIRVNVHKDNQICAGGEHGKDSCAGDSGGPLMVERGGVWYMEGIVSFGLSCGKDGWPGVYTNIPKYYNWIKTTITRKLTNYMAKASKRQGRRK